MERDFMGLGSKNVGVMVKEDAINGSKDSVVVSGSGMQWSFSNKVSAIPQFLSFKTAQEDRSRKTVHDPLASSGFMTSTADAFDSNSKPFSGMVQKNMILDKQAGNHYAMKTYALQHFDAYQVHHPNEVRIFPVTNQPNPRISMSTPVLQSHLASAGRSTFGNTVNPQPLGGVPIIAPVSIHPTTSSNTGTTDLRNASKSSGAPAQLTIFYAGSVNVYDDVSPEKAQAIMLMAGNGSSMTRNKTLPGTQVQAPIPRPSAGDAYIGNKPHTTISLCSGLPSPISVTPYVGSQSGGGSGSANELATVKPIGALASPINQPEPPKLVSSVGSVATSIIPAVAVPQARKASLARFLEKRKERATSTLPYSVSMKSPGSSTAVSGDVSFSVNSGGSCSLSAIN